LKRFQNEWKGNEIKSQSAKNTKELFNMLLKANSALANLLLGGNRVGNQFGNEDVVPEFKSSYYPTFFKLEKPSSESRPREIETSRQAKINLTTDAPNDYFTRPMDPGSFKVYENEREITHSDGVKVSGFNGKWILSLPSSDELIQKYRFMIEDSSRVIPFEETFYLKLIDKKVHSKSTPKRSKDMRDLPNLIEIGKDDFEAFGIDKYDVLKVLESDNGYEYYLNIDNVHMQSYLKAAKNEQIEEAKKQYELAVALMGLILIQDYKDQEGETPLGEFTRNYTRKISPLILPLVRDVAKV
jgi:hypothetical protein